MCDGAYVVHSRFNRVVNMTDGERLVALVKPGVEAGPVNIVTAGLDCARVCRLDVRARRVIVDGRHCEAPDSVYRSGIDAGPNALPVLLGNVPELETSLLSLAADRSLAFLLDPERLSRLRPGFERNVAGHMLNCSRDAAHGDTLRGVRRMRGCGFGLTPSGDDFVVGFLTGMAILEKVTSRDLSASRAAVAAAGRTGNVMTDTFLDLAADGRASESMKNLASALTSGATPDVRAAVQRVCSIGATSGADAAVGLHCAVSTLPARWSRAPRSRLTFGGTPRSGEAQWL